MELSRTLVLLCLPLAGCAAKGRDWAYNTCGDPHAVDISSLDGGLDAGSNPSPGVSLPSVDIHSLLDEMAALAGLARRAPNPFRTCMVSSYDRHSIVPQASSDTPTGWYANHDWENYLGTEKGPSGRAEFVLLDADGPGSIVRIWSANPVGTLRIYLDHAAKPALDAPLSALLTGQFAPLLPPFAGMTAKGGNLEFPFPFRQHVKVAWEGGGGFYQITYRKYVSRATDVTSFDLSSLDPEELDSVRVRLQQPALQGNSIVSERAVLTVASPKMTIAASPAGEEILELQVRPSRSDAASLRGSVLSLRFDGKETVRAPLGDFFGAGPGLLPHATLPLEATADGLLSARFVMAFAKSAVVRIDPAPGLAATVTVFHQAAAFDPSTYYFHAHWSARGPTPSRPYRDLPLADVAGAGAYVGTFLAVGNYSTDWWGEGDEKIWVDDDAFPSLFGTGTEDYFGQAYCSPEIYNHPYRAQSRAAGGFGAARGLFSILRTHVLDPIPFTTNLKFNLELWHWDDSALVTLDTVSYFYLAPDATDNLPPPTAADFRLSPLGR